MQCKYLKLTSGESIIALTNDIPEEGSKSFLEVIDPVLINSVAVPLDNMIVETYVMQPWIKMAKTNTVKIYINNIVATMDVSEKAESQYKSYIVEYNKQTEEINEKDLPPDEEILDLFLNGEQEESEDDEEDYAEYRTRRTTTRTVH